jgi:hypothetical protein
MFLQMKHIIYGFTIALCIAALLALAQTEVRFNNWGWGNDTTEAEIQRPTQGGRQKQREREGVIERQREWQRQSGRGICRKAERQRELQRLEGYRQTLRVWGSDRGWD